MSASWQLPSYVRRGDVLLTLSARAGMPPPPYEFRGILSEEEYQSRMNQIISMLRKYAWSLGERIFLLFGLVVTVVAPIAIWEVLARQGIKQVQDNSNNDFPPDRVQIQQEQDAFFRARAISMGTLLGLGLVLWVPYFLFKRLGNRKLSQLLSGFSAQDASRGPQFALRWTIPTTSAFGRTASVAIQLPAFGQPTVFHPQAYLPPYMARAETFTQFAPPAGAPPHAVPINAEVGEWEDEKRA